jgi:hypothetical protein
MSLKKICLLVSSVVLLNGCAMYKVGDLPQAQLAPSTTSLISPSLTYSLQAEMKMFGTQKVPEFGLKKLRSEFETASWETGYFSQTSSYGPNADIQLSMMLTDSGNPAAMIPAVITGLSFYIIPSWATDNFELRVSAKANGVSKTYVVKDSTRIVQWLPMAFVFPFHNFSTVTDVRKNMYKTVIQRMQRDGLLVKKEAASPAP